MLLVFLSFLLPVRAIRLVAGVDSPLADRLDTIHTSKDVTLDGADNFRVLVLILRIAFFL